MLLTGAQPVSRILATGKPNWLWLLSGWISNNRIGNTDKPFERVSFLDNNQSAGDDIRKAGSTQLLFCLKIGYPVMLNNQPNSHILKPFIFFFILKSIILIRFQSKFIHINYSPSILVSKIILIDSNLLILLNILKIRICAFWVFQITTSIECSPYEFYHSFLLYYALTFSYALLLSLWIDDDYWLIFGCFIFG